MSSWNKVQGDVNDTVTVTLSGVENLVGATATANVWRAGTTATALVATITSTSNRTVSIALGAGAGWLSSAAAGTWYLETQVTFGDGTILTWPSKGTDTIHVRADG